MINKKRVCKCRYCKKSLRDYNKSGICSTCRNTYRFISDKQKLLKRYVSK